MDQEEPEFEDAYKKFTQSLSKDELDDYKIADHLRSTAAIEIKQSMKRQSSYATADLLDQNLTYYFDHVTNTNPNSVNNYMDNIMELMQQHTNIEEEGFSPVKVSYLDDPLKYLMASQCQGEYENCKNDEITEKMLKSWFKSEPKDQNPPKNVQNTVQPINVPNTVQPIRNEPPVVTLKTTQIQTNPIVSNNAPSKTFSAFQFKERKTEVVFPSSQVSVVADISKSIFGKPVQNFCSKIVTKGIKRASPHNSQSPEKKTDFKTGMEEFKIQHIKKNGNSSMPPMINYGKKSLGGRRGAVHERFVSPLLGANDENQLNKNLDKYNDEDEEIDERLKNIDKKMIELIKNEIMETSSNVTWDDIAGLQSAKSVIYEAVILPLLRPDIFNGLRSAPRGILLFGPPGTGKTLIGKCIASQSNATFFSISASSLTSKWVGECEKMVRALFAVAKVHQPSVIFIDEIDSMLCQRSESEHESSRRLKTEFLVQLDGAGTSGEERILIVGATNRPQELDEAARRRLVKRLYIPLPIKEARIQIVQNLLKTLPNILSMGDVDQIGEMTEGYSGADMKSLCHDASMGPIRELTAEQMTSIATADLRSVNFNDFKLALDRVRPSVSQRDLHQYLEWNKLYGSG